MNVKRWVETAQPLIKPYIRHTYLEYSEYLSGIIEGEVYLKLESLQVTGSFKARGGLSKVLSLTDLELKKGVIAASTGNHAAAVANAVRIADGKATIYMPETVSSVKVENLKKYPNINIVLVGKDSVESEIEAIKQAEIQGKVYISPYNDEKIIGGQGTIGIEILEDLPEVSDVLVPVGGGGLISGIGGYLKDVNEHISIIGCQPENSAVMYHSIRAGRVLELESLPTISDGTAGGMEADSITFPICQQVVDKYHLVTESEILEALAILMRQHQLIAEGAAGLAVASLIRHRDEYWGKKVVLIICGNKMSQELMNNVLALSSK